MNYHKGGVTKMLITSFRTEQEVEDLIFTLEISIKYLPMDAHPAHEQRLNRLIEDIEYSKRKEI